MTRPTLIVISGPSGCGKTTLAHRLARAIPCPAVCRDEIKEGMVHAVGRFDAGPGDELTRRTFPTFFAVLRLLLTAGVTVVGEAAFQDALWRPNLEPLAALARLRVIQCYADPAVATERIRSRERSAHADATVLRAIEEGIDVFGDFDRVRIDAPSLDVDTTTSYDPPIESIVAFVNQDG